MIELKDLEQALNESYNNYVNVQAEIRVLQKLIEIEKSKEQPEKEVENVETENI